MKQGNRLLRHIITITVQENHSNKVLTFIIFKIKIVNHIKKINNLNNRLLINSSDDIIIGLDVLPNIFS